MTDFGAFSGNIFSTGANEDAEDEDGLLASIIESVAADIKGATKVGLAIPFSGLEALGAQVPFTFDDLKTRDWIGAAAVASAAIGGLAASGARSVLAGQGLRGIGKGAARKATEAWAARAGFAQRAAITAGAEASAGVFFGSVKPLESGEDRLEEILGDAALFGTFGAGASLLGSGFRATIGGRLAQMKGTTKAALLRETAQRREASRSLAEFAGIALRNPESGATRRIHRLADGSVKVVEGEHTFVHENFNSALSESFTFGFSEHLGVSRNRLTSSSIREALPQDLLEALDATNGNLSEVVDKLHFANYSATREALAKAGEESALWSWLSAETSIPSDALGIPNISPSFKRDVLQVVPKDVARRLSKVEDPSEFLRQAALEGALDVENLLTGAEMRNFVDELFANGFVPEGSVFSAHTPYDATILSKFLTPRFVAKIHPEIAPLAELGSVASEAYTLGLRDVKQFLFEIENTVSPAAVTKGVQIIEASAEAGGIRTARERALTLARETGDNQVVSFVERVTERLNLARLRLVAAGRLGGSDLPKDEADAARAAITQALAQESTSDAVEALAERLQPGVREMLDDAGLAGYFPIVHTGQVRVDINGVAEPAFFDTFNEARRFLIEEGGMKGGYISNAFASDSLVSGAVSPREFGKLVKTIRDLDGVQITAKEASKMLVEGGTFPSAGPRKFSRHLLPRRLGTRDFAEEPLRALDLYLANTERTLAFNTFARDANRVIENLPVAKGGLRAWAEDQRDLLLGKPTRAERVVADVLKGIAPGEVSQAALRRYSGMIRWGQGLFKLGGVWSGLINATQFAVNTTPILGARWAAEGLASFFNPAARKRVEALVAKHNIDLGLHVSLTQEGKIIGGETISEEIRAAVSRLKLGNVPGGAKAAGTALENMWMFTFNAAERMNRLGTFWGAFRKASTEGMSEDAAVAFARDLVLKTQFDYSVANLPQALQGPVGSVLGQFKTFFINEIELIASLDNATRLKMMIAFQALGGAGAILAVPGADLADAASRYFFDVKASEAIKLEGGREDSGSLMRFAAFGAPGLLNLDLTNYIGPGGFNQLTLGLLGPTVSDLNAWREFFSGALRDVRSTGFLQPTTINAWMQRVMPAQIRRFQRGMNVFATGEVRNAYSGKLVYRPDDRLSAALKTALGAPGVQTSLERIQDDIITRETEAYREARESYRRQIALAAIEGDQSEVQRLLRRAKSSGYVFTPGDVHRAVGSFRRDASERRERRTPVALRTEFEDFFELDTNIATFPR